MFHNTLMPTAQYMHGPGSGMGGGWFGFMPFGWFGILILIGIVILIMALVRRGGNDGIGQYRERPSESALDVLKRRYAAGEITREEYQEMKRDIET